MRLNKIYFFLFVFIGNLASYPQSLPSYLERDFFFSDSLQKISLPVATPSDGVISADEYLVGPGDKLLLLINGVIDQSYQIVVDHEDNIYIPKVGLINVKDLTLNKAKDKIIKELSAFYKNVTIQISLLDFKKIKVNLLGNVVRAGSYILNANSRLLDLFLVATGLHDNSDMRNIRINSISNENRKYDLVSFLRLGDKKNNPYLHEGDVVTVNRSDKVVSINGAVQYPGTYEFVENESLQNFIDIAGGFLDRAKRDTIEVTSFLSDDKTIISMFYTYDEIINKNILLKRGDRVLVREKSLYLIDQFVTVNGYVKYPGMYKIVKDQTDLYDLLINQAGGFLKDASLKDAYVIRTIGSIEKDPELERLKMIPRADMDDDEYDYLKQKSRHIKGRMVVDFQRLFIDKDTSENITLKRGDIIEIPEHKNYVTLVGQVIHPGNIIYNPNYNIEKYIELAGGFGWRALEGDIRVIKANSGEWLDEDDVESLEPGDIIWIPEDPPNPRFWDVFETSLNIVGQIATVVAATVAVIIAVRK